MKRLYSILIACFFVFGVNQIQAQQEVLYLDAVNPVFSVMFPNEWKVGSENGKYAVSPASNDLNFYLWEVKEKTIDDALKNILGLVNEFVVETSFDSAKEIKKKNIKLTEIIGTGKDKNGKNVDVVVSLFEAKKRILIVICYAEPGALKKQKTTINDIMNSITAK